jgi:SAM-dependent methyltransferase
MTAIGLVPRMRWWWRWRGHLAAGRPTERAENAVLRTLAEREAAVAEVERLGLPLYDDRPKNWDSLVALHAILSRTDASSRVLDAGAVPNSVILPWLAMYGYHDLVGINLDVKRPFAIGPIRYDHGDITRTEFADASFDAITCLSVIEHGVPVDSFLAEMARLLKPGGVLVTSTDYWHAPVDTAGLVAWGAPVKVFQADDIRALVECARSLGLTPTGELDLACEERVVHWKRMRLDYTFVVLTFERARSVHHNPP